MGSFGKNALFIQTLSETSTASGAGTASPRRMRFNRSNWAMARYICRSSFVSYLRIFSSTSMDGSTAAACRAFHQDGLKEHDSTGTRLVAFLQHPLGITQGPSLVRMELLQKSPLVFRELSFSLQLRGMQVPDANQISALQEFVPLLLLSISWPPKLPALASFGSSIHALRFLAPCNPRSRALAIPECHAERQRW